MTNKNKQNEEKACPYCFELVENCVCVWTECSECGARIPESEAYEYRGRIWCGKHDFDEQVDKRDRERQQVMEVTNASVASQRIGEFVNNRSKYNINNVAGDGLPIIKIKEPQVLKEYEKRKQK